MEKLYTNEEYSQLARQASETGETLYKVRGMVDYQVEVYEYEKKTIQVPVINPETGEPTGETQTIEVDDLTKPIMIDGFDDEGNPIKIHKHHTETRQKYAETLDIKSAGYYICSESNITDGTLNPDFEQEQAEKQKQKRIKEIKAELDALDLKSVRPLRAGETDRLETLEAQAVALRQELQELINEN